MDKYWNAFLSSGKISDYLKYRENEKNNDFSSDKQYGGANAFNGVTSYADNDKRNSNS